MQLYREFTPHQSYYLVNPLNFAFMQDLDVGLWQNGGEEDETKKSKTLDQSGCSSGHCPKEPPDSRVPWHWHPLKPEVKISQVSCGEGAENKMHFNSMSSC